MIGKTLGQYQITHKLGAGGMGVVYRARDTKLERAVALKVLPAERLAAPAAQSRLLDEARMASALNHPNICTIYEVGCEGGVTFAAMEYVEGRSMRAQVPAEGLPIELVIRYGAQVADAISYAHDHGVVHRDIKTANVMVTPEGRVKVLDFGLARRVASEAEQATRGEVSVAEERVAGTLHYLAPEVLRGESADARSDIWATGVVLYEMAAGRLPYDAASSFELTSAILRDPLPPLPVRVPAGLRAIIQRCLAREPGQRYQRAGEVRAALETISSSDLAIPAAAPTAGTPGTRGGERWMLATAAALLLAVVVWFAWQRWTAPSGGKGIGAVKLAPVGGGARTSTGAVSSTNPEANEYFEKGMHFLTTQVDMPKARLMFGRAVQLDAKFAEARGWHGFSMFLEVDSGNSNDAVWLYRAEEEIRQTLLDDPQNGHAHTTLGALHYYRGRTDLMKEELEKALAINPNDFDAKFWLAQNYYARTGDYATATGMMQAVLARQPLITPVRAGLAIALREHGDENGALREFQKIQEQDPRNPFLTYMARLLMQANDLTTARVALERLKVLYAKNFDFRITWATLLALEGKRDEARRELDADVNKYGALCPWAMLYVAEAYAVVGESRQALEWLDRSVRMGDERFEWFESDPLLASLRKQPRFRQIVESMKFQRQQRQKKSP